MKGLSIRAAVTVASVYGFFLIFAQFAFVGLLRGGGIGLSGEKVVLGAMAIAGIGGGFFIAWRGVTPRAARIALLAAGLAAALAPAAAGMPAFLAIAVATGADLGVATVSLSALLPAWCGMVWVGIGTGIGYALCNLPAVFSRPPAEQAWVAAGFAAAGAIAVPNQTTWRLESAVTRVYPIWGTVVLFTALVWMDSAAFFIIQHASDLKSGTWGDAMLWRNAVLHLTAACLAGVWLKRGGARLLPLAAWILLAVACLAVNSDSTRGIAGWLYPAGVSLYSVALVAWPGWFSGAGGTGAAAWRGAWLFAIAGWFGSANGIGMSQSLERVPPMFVAGAGLAVAAVMVLSDFRRWRVVMVAAGVVVVGLLGGHSRGHDVPNAMERGRSVYVSEGCIHCHTQYVRPGLPDEEFWGPARPVAMALEGEPVLIGNRRQGPDLTNVGARRSEAWLIAHFIDPRGLVADSPMPSYNYLFQDGRGGDLVRYLKDSGVGETGDLIRRSAAWRPRETGTSADGKRLFAANCAACHGNEARGDGSYAKHFLKPPANLVDGPFAWTAAGADQDLHLARAIKFGIPGTDMPGHETLTDGQVIALVSEVLDLRGR